MRSLSDRQRHDAYEALTDAFADRTDLVIEMLRPAHDLATTADVESARSALGRDVDAVRRDLGQNIESFRRDLGDDVAAVRRDLGADISTVRRDLGEEIASVRVDLGQEIEGLRHDIGAMEARLTMATERLVHEAFAAQTRTVMFGLVGAFVLTALTNVLTVALG